VKLVQLKRQAGNGSAGVVPAVGPMEDADADAYAAELLHLLEQPPDRGLFVGTTSVETTSGDAAEPPATPAELLRAVLSSHDGEHGLPEPDPRG